ncbi:MAG: choice-of-anchor D domain-containing protein [Myxococcaceae bacterium]
MSRAWWLGALALFVFDACQCNRTTLTGRPGELVAVQTSATGRELFLKDATFTLPATFMGETGTLDIPVRNIGLGAVSISAVNRTEGDEAITLDGTGLVVDVDGQATLKATFSPPQATDATLASDPHRAVFVLDLAGTASGDEHIRLELVGEGVARDCFVPALVDFGQVPLRQALTTDVTLRNGGPLATTSTLGVMEGADAFAFDLTSAGTTIDVPPMGSISLTARFSPLEARPYEASLTMRRGPACPEGRTVFRGEGNDAAFAWLPQRLDFGRVPLGFQVTRQLVVSNGAKVPVGTTVSVNDPNFLIVTAPSQLAAQGTTTFELGCMPQQLGPLSAVLTVEIATTPPLTARVPMTCTGGGPRIRVDPNPVQFGWVPLDATTRRRIVVQNVGTAPSMPGDSSLNLVLGGPGGALPWFGIVPTNANTQASDFGVSLLTTSYVPSVGVPAVAGQNMVEFELTVTPHQTTLLREAELVVMSNDPLQPSVRIPISAQPRNHEPCAISLAPGDFNFGRTAKGTTLTRTVMVTNVSPSPSSLCLVSGIEIQPGSDSAFQVTRPANASLLIPGGSSQPIVVTASVSPTAPIGQYLRGAVRLHVDGETTDRSIPIDLLVSQCLVVDPPVVNVGLVQLGCTSAGRPITVYDICSTDLQLSGIDQPSLPFHLTQAPAVPATVGPTSPTTLSVNAAPLTAGSYVGSITLHAGAETAQVTLIGAADATGQQSDQFVQSASTTDILLVVDNSCSMGDEQVALGTNFASFISSASMSSGDFHIGVITTDPAERGHLRFNPGEPVVLTPSTANLATLFERRVAVGTGGTGIEQPFASMELALTEPALSSANRGFIRPDAFLAVVVVTDALEQSSNSVGSYLATLRNLKGNRRELFSVNVVGPFTPPSSTCMTEGQVDDGRFNAAITQSGGVKADICTRDWATELRAVSQSVFGSQRNFELTGTARGPGDITVTIDGGVVSNWGYDPATNSVVFSPPPPTGANIDITYRTACF